MSVLSETLPFVTSRIERDFCVATTQKSRSILSGYKYQGKVGQFFYST